MTTYIRSLTLPRVIFEQPAASILLPLTIGPAIGYAISPGKQTKTYMALKQPPYRPPPEVFGPVWTFLYGSMGYAAYRAWTSGIDSYDPRIVDMTLSGATFYTIQLAFNFAWTPLFFGAKRPVEALIDSVALTGTAWYTTYLWFHVDKVAGYTLLPYCAWLGFATYLCAGSGYLNGWDFSDKETEKPPTEKEEDTKFVNEKDE